MSANDAHNSGAKAGNLVKEGAAKIHGIGEALRGNINTFADSATGTDSSKSRAVAERGEQEFATGQYAGTGAGVTPHDTGRERLNRDIQGEGNTFTHGDPTTAGTTHGGLAHGGTTTTGRTL